MVDHGEAYAKSGEFTTTDGFASAAASPDRGPAFAGFFDESIGGVTDNFASGTSTHFGSRTKVSNRW